MKIKILSDLHTEFGFVWGFKDIFKTDCDLIIIAGDLGNSNNIVEMLKYIDIITSCHVLFVPGNHEYYGSAKFQIDAELHELNLENITVLNDNEYIKDDILFIGSTGWWEDFDPKCTTMMNDFNLISDIYSNDNGKLWGKKSRLFVESSLFNNKHTDNYKTVVITHNMPSKKCVHSKFNGSILNDCFAMNFDDIIDTYKPNIWVCGHTHDSVYMHIRDTQIICNPYGYHNVNINDFFNKDMVITI